MTKLLCWRVSSTNQQHTTHENDTFKVAVVQTQWLNRKQHVTEADHWWCYQVTWHGIWEHRPACVKKNRPPGPQQRVQRSARQPLQVAASPQLWERGSRGWDQPGAGFCCRAALAAGPFCSSCHSRFGRLYGGLSETGLSLGGLSAQRAI